MRSDTSGHGSSNTWIVLRVGILLALLLTLGCSERMRNQLRPGRVEYQAALHRPVPGGIVNLAGGNLIVAREDLSIDTVFGPLVVGAHYNSATNRWTWSFDMTYDGVRFVDETGARHIVAWLADGAAIPGTHWVKLDATRIKTKGGLVYAFDPLTDRLSSVFWEGDGGRPALVYLADPAASDGRIATLSQCRANGECGLVYRIERDPNGCVSAIVDRASRRVEIESDAACRQTLARDPLSIESGWPGRRYTYTAERLVSQVNDEGERVHYGYADGRIAFVEAIGEGNPRTRFDYAFDLATFLHSTEVTDPSGARTIFRYGAVGRIHSRIDALGGETRWSWSGRRPVSHVDVAGVETRWEYEDDDAVRRIEPGGNVVQITYAPQARNMIDPRRRAILRVEDVLGLRIERTYSASGVLLTEANGAGDVTRFGFDAEGLLRRLTRPSGVEMRFSDYAAHGHPETMRLDSIFDHRVYDEVGNHLEGEEIEATLAPGRPGIVRRRFDANRNLAGLTLRGGTDSSPDVDETVELLIVHRSDGQLLRVERPYGGDLERDYDALGRVVAERERVNGAWQTTTFEWDLAGRLVAHTRANGMRREIDYDALGRIVAVRLLARAGLEKTLDLEYADGRLVRRIDTSQPGDERFEYDTAGRLARTVHPGGEVSESSYDLRSREVERRYLLGPGSPALRTLRFNYDAADRRIGLLDDAELLVERAYLEGRVVEDRYANGLVRTYVYDPTFGGLSETMMLDADGELVEQTSIELGECSPIEGCLLAETISYAGARGGVDAQTWEAHLFPLPAGRTRETDRPGARVTGFAPTATLDLVGLEQRRYAFDVLGNWIGAGPVGGRPPTAQFEFNSERNRLLAKTSEPSRSYAYDEAGFLVMRDAKPLRWDAGGRIAAIGTALEFEWDVLGRLIRRRVNGVEARVRFGGEVEADANGLPLALDLGAVRIDLVSGARRYRHLDFRGNVKLVSDDAGQVVLHYGYSPFGVDARYGKDPDAVSFAQGRSLGAFLLLGARLYDPETGRFISPDPITHVVNQFAYTLGNPISLWDPDGLYAKPVSSSASPTGSFDWVNVELGQSLVMFGTAITAASINVGNPYGVVAGGTIWATGVVIIVYDSSASAPAAAPPSAPPAAAPHATPDAGAGEGAASDSIEISAGTSTCAPTALAAGEIGGGPLIVLTGLHALAALVWLAGRRRRRAQRHRT